jgi:hypothetical protein
VLLSIATGPLLFPRIWHAQYGNIVAGWAALAVAFRALARPCAGRRPTGTAKTFWITA